MVSLQLCNKLIDKYHIMYRSKMPRIKFNEKVYSFQNFICIIKYMNDTLV